MHPVSTDAPWPDRASTDPVSPIVPLVLRCAFGPLGPSVGAWCRGEPAPVQSSGPPPCLPCRRPNAPTGAIARHRTMRVSAVGRGEHRPAPAREVRWLDRSWTPHRSSVASPPCEPRPDGYRRPAGRRAGPATALPASSIRRTRPPPTRRRRTRSTASPRTCLHDDTLPLGGDQGSVAKPRDVHISARDQDHRRSRLQGKTVHLACQQPA